MPLNTTSPHLLVIDPSLNHAEPQGAAQVLEGWPGSSRVVLPALDRAQMIHANDGYEGLSGVVLMGSASSVYDDHLWLRELGGWLRPILDGRVDLPLLGICFGHQLIAHLEGGRVGYLSADQSKRRGVETSHFVPSRLLGEPVVLRVVVSHREVVEVAPPERYRVIAQRPGVTCDALEHASRSIFTAQFHPEARDEFARNAGIDVEVIDREVDEDGQRFLTAFRQVVVDSLGT